MSYQRIVQNLKGVKGRAEMLEGRQHTVVPMVMAVEGVLNGSNGPLYYPGEELAKFPFAWDAKPIVIDHPTVQNDGSTSACTKKVLETRKVGTILNTKYTPGKAGKPGKLTAEAWIDNEKADLVDPRLLQNIEAGTVTEISTGLAVDSEEATGEFNGKPYEAIARNYRPDHLAILLDSVGACSVKDGAGLMRNQEGPKQSVIGNAASFQDIQEALREAVRPLVLGSLPREDENVWFVDVFPTLKQFVVEHYSKGKSRLIRFPYTMTKDTASIPSDARGEIVKRVVSYAPVEETTQNKEPVMDKQARIAALIANGSFSEEDRKGLEAMSEATVEALHNGKGKVPPKTPKPLEDDEEEVMNEDGTKTVVKKKKTVPATPANAAAKITAEQFISNAPPEIAEVLSSGIEAFRAEQAALIGQITANSDFTAEALQTKPIKELRQLAKLATKVSKPAANYTGQAGTPGTVTSNKAASEPLVAPPVVNSAT